MKFKAYFKSIPTIETPRLFLKKITPENALDMYEYASLESVTKYLLWTPHLNLRETKGQIEYLARQYKRGMFSDWGLNLKSGTLGESVPLRDKFIGTCGFTSVDFELQRGELGYVLSPFYQQHGLMREAVGAVLKVAFVDFGLEEMFIRVMDGNIASIKLGESFGFVHTKTDYECLFVKNELKTVHTFVLTREDYLKAVCT